MCEHIIKIFNIEVWKKWMFLEFQKTVEYTELHLFN